MTDNDTKRYVLHSVESAFSVLDLFFNHEELSPTDVSNLLGINRSTAFRLLVSLEECGYIVKNENAKYRLTMKVSSLGQVSQNRMELINTIHPYLIRLTDATRETSHLAVMETPTHVTFVDKCIGMMMLKMDVILGFTQPAHQTATGKAILANETDTFINSYIRNATFKPLTSKSIPDARGLLEVLEAIRQQRYSCDDEESELGLTCYAVPIITAGGRPIAAISISGPTTRMEANKEDLLMNLKQTRSEIEENFR
ncbi:MAG: IclR family transcriptional regulator [Eubacteriaceae bacterium]|nr:IclR family transcriptional regulator [Eubacteriaceae bacterium]